METQNYGRVFAAETVGTTVLMIAGPGAGILAGQSLGPLGVALGFGFGLMIMMYCIGPISGCHINPAVTLGMLLAKKVDRRHALAAVAGQLIGAVAGAAMVFGIARGNVGFARGNFGANGFDRVAQANRLVPEVGGTPFSSLGSAIVIEVLLTALLVMVMLFTTSKKFAVGFGGLVAGLTLALIYMVSIPIDNGSVNPARSLGTALFAGPDWIGLKQLWVFIVFPLVGAVVGVVAWLVLDDARLEDTMLAAVPGATEIRDTLDDATDAVGDVVEDASD